MSDKILNLLTVFFGCCALSGGITIFASKNLNNVMTSALLVFGLFLAVMCQGIKNIKN